MDITKSDIIMLLKTLTTNGIFDKELCSELEEHITNFDDSAFDKSYATIELHFNGLLPLKDMNNNSKGYDHYEISCLSKNLLQAMKFEKYSIVELLIQLKLTYNSLLTANRPAKVQNFPLYYEQTSHERLQSDQTEQNDFLNELMNAPLDDIGIYLEEKRYRFEQIYTRDTIDELVYRVNHHNTCTISDPYDILDQLRILIIGRMTEKYTPLTGIQLITYIDDQYHSNETYKYRVLLEKFVQIKPQPEFTFANFYRIVNIKPVFKEEQEMPLRSLFTIYCQKLLGIDKNKCHIRDLPERRPRQCRKISEQFARRANAQKMAHDAHPHKGNSFKRKLLQIFTGIFYTEAYRY
jgi:hypothetical protein